MNSAPHTSTQLLAQQHVFRHSLQLSMAHDTRSRHSLNSTTSQAAPLSHKPHCNCDYVSRVLCRRQQEAVKAWSHHEKQECAGMVAHLCTGQA
jgi:hypothetical protein